MTTGDGGESERLAPVTPLFGGRSMPQTRSVPPRASGGRGPVFREDPEDEVTPDDAGDRAMPGRSDARRGSSARSRPEGERASRTGGARSTRPRAGDTAPDGPVPDARDTVEPLDPAARAEAAEKALLRKLRARSLSVQEARSVLVGHDLDADRVDAMLDRMHDLGYLNDAALAEQLVHSGVERRGQGRQVISQTLAKRGVPRDVADAALASLPDDDLERALDFARRKARAVGGKDHQAALRRLVGQLSRRGYPSGVSMTAARQALDEIGS